MSSVISSPNASAMLEGRHADGLSCPQPIAIAHTLVRAWIEGETP